MSDGGSLYGLNFCVYFSLFSIYRAEGDSVCIGSFFGTFIAVMTSVWRCCGQKLCHSPTFRFPKCCRWYICGSIESENGEDVFGKCIICKWCLALSTADNASWVKNCEIELSPNDLMCEFICCSKSIASIGSLQVKK